jgi:DNA-binding response OmpR family regulator
MRKRVLFIANSLDNARKFHQLLLEIDAEVSAGSTAQIVQLLSNGPVPDLLIFEAQGSALPYLEEVEALAEDGEFPILAIVNEADIATASIPPSALGDFVTRDAGRAECLARIKRLMKGGALEPTVDIITVDSMEINLATYQVTIAGESVDLTYLEYALLVFLVQNAGYTLTREVLLQNVWGFDYYGGSRTVDVHVRRIRAKLGPSLASHLETVRGVGYLWRES